MTFISSTVVVLLFFLIPVLLMFCLWRAVVVAVLPAVLVMAAVAVVRMSDLSAMFFYRQEQRLSLLVLVGLAVLQRQLAALLGVLLV